jgi:hypothetical protein
VNVKTLCVEQKRSSIEVPLEIKLEEEEQQ